MHRLVIEFLPQKQYCVGPICVQGGQGPAWHVDGQGCGHFFGMVRGLAQVCPQEKGGSPGSGFGSTSFSHQHVNVVGKVSFGRLQPGHRHCLGGGMSPFSACCRAAAAPSLPDHDLMHFMWKTVQHVRQDQAADLLDSLS